MKYFILDEQHQAVPVADVMRWARWFQEADRCIVERTIVQPNVEVSTVFLGFDHQWSRGGPPQLFETMIFGGTLDGRQWRCATWEEAETMHAAAVDQAAATR